MKLFKLICIIALIFTMHQALAANISAVNSHSCKKLQGSEQPFLLVLEKGENVKDAILTCANDAKLAGASLSGLGAFDNTTLSYFNHDTKKYQEKTFKGMLEVIALNGNIAQLDGKYVVHLHVALSDDKYHMMGGHLSQAIIGPTTEITVIPFRGDVVKKKNDEIGIELISTEE